MKRILLTAAVLMLVAGAADAKQVVCFGAGHKIVKCPPAPAASSAPASSAHSATSSHPPHCVKGKVCGNTCIAVDKTCHK